MGCRNTTWLAAVRFAPEADCARERRRTNVAEAGLLCQSRITPDLWLTPPCSWMAGIPNSPRAAATFRFRSSNWTKRITFAVVSSRRSSCSFWTSAASFVPYLSCWTFSAPGVVAGLNAVEGGAAEDDEDDDEDLLGPPAPSSFARGRTSFADSCWRHMLHDLNLEIVAWRQSMQKACAHGVIASLSRGRPSSRHTVQLRASGESSRSRAITVRRKNSSEPVAS
mmetsp:Transcript_126187/g.356853  ORF Transcript_126187/g.356853 Transcript_126187/m.356853 type:complete len:224 (+) Transcript_126187:439-1110(+)